MSQPSRAAKASLVTSAIAISRLKALAAHSGDGRFRMLTTLEHQVTACIVAGDNYAEAARYIGVSPSTVRRAVVRAVARLSGVLRVLVADDHPAHRIILTAGFESLGCSVQIVEDGAQAVAMAASFDVICLDRNMGGMGGDEAARLIGRRAFLIACTSQPEGASACFDAVITKPISWRAMALAIQTAQREIPERRQSGTD